MRLLHDMLTGLRRGGIAFPKLGRKHVPDLSTDPFEAAKAVLSATGEVSSLVYAENLLTVVESLDDQGLTGLLGDLLASQDIDANHLGAVTARYAAKPTKDGLAAIAAAAEPGWMELFRRVNATPNGTVRLVRLRERMHRLMRKTPEFGRIDVGLVSLLRNWFNPGFLVLQPIDWSTPANILEKIIAYEAVHAITSWDDLRARLAPEDRRCFAFFHPAMPDEPLIFVEVALTRAIPRRIDHVLASKREISAAEQATTAVFYSISNCQNGLAGISFGNFLIKRVARQLHQELPNLTQFVTLSPVPGLMKWLATNQPELAARFADADADFWPNVAEETRPEFLKAAIAFLTQSDREDGLPNDSVARFHLGNGAILEQINYGGDRSAKGMAQAGGLMVNYLYDLDVVERNHEEFVRTKAVPLSNRVKSMIKSL